jgi:hypothetical protein
LEYARNRIAGIRWIDLMIQVRPLKNVEVSSAFFTVLGIALAACYASPNAPLRVSIATEVDVFQLSSE